MAWTARALAAPEPVETETVEIEARAAEWRVQAEDYRRYEELMRGARGHWSPGADPLLVLGSHARTDAERQRFAELHVRKEYERAQGELAFARAVAGAWERLYPGSARVVLAAAEPKSSGSSGIAARYAVLVEPGCAGCRGLVGEYLAKTARDRGPVVDFYVRGLAGDDARLREWVREHGIPRERIRAGRVTINHGGGYVEPAPAVWERGGGGRWLRR